MPIIRRNLLRSNFHDDTLKFGVKNEFWNVVWDDETLAATVSYGRVGTNGASKGFTWDKYEFERRVNDKLRKGYSEVTLHVPTAAVVQQVGATREHPKVEEITAMIFRAAGENIASYLRVAVDALSKDQLDKARSLLPRIERLKGDQATKVAGSQKQRELLDEIQTYFNYVPTTVPNRVLDRYADIIVPFIPGEQEDRLDQLEAALASHVAQATGGTSQYTALGAQLKWLDPKLPEYKVFADAYGKRNMRIKDVFLIKSPSNIAAWESEDYGKHVIASLDPASNAKELRGITPVFHGTRNPYVRHILRTGIRIPQVSGHVANGSRFGFGAYFADDPYRSNSYTQAGHGEPRIMFVSDVAVGTWKELDGDDSRLRSAPAGFHSVRGVRSWSGMDEWIIYRASQHRLMAFVTL